MLNPDLIGVHPPALVRLTKGMGLLILAAVFHIVQRAALQRDLSSIVIELDILNQQRGHKVHLHLGCKIHQDCRRSQRQSNSLIRTDSHSYARQLILQLRLQSSHVHPAIGLFWDIHRHAPRRGIIFHLLIRVKVIHHEGIGVAPILIRPPAHLSLLLLIGPLIPILHPSQLHKTSQVCLCGVVGARQHIVNHQPVCVKIGDGQSTVRIGCIAGNVALNLRLLHGVGDARARRVVSG